MDLETVIGIRIRCWRHVSELNLWDTRRVFEPDSPGSGYCGCSRVSLVRVNCVDDTSLLSVCSIHHLRHQRQSDRIGSSRGVKVSIRGGTVWMLMSVVNTKGPVERCP